MVAGLNVLLGKHRKLSVEELDCLAIGLGVL